MITVTMPVLARCPFKDEIDAISLSVTCPENAPELHGLAAKVYELTLREPVSHEDFARCVLALLPAEALVVLKGRVGPWDVEVREGAAVA